MSRLPELLAQRKPEVEAICRRHGVVLLDAFGSVVRSKPADGFDAFDQARSDLDFVVRFAPEARRPWGGEFLALQEALEVLFGRRVDLIEESNWTSPYFAAKVRSERVPLYAAA